MRSGHTEACVDLCRLAGLPAVGVLAELMNDDGTVMRGPTVTSLRREAQAQADFDRRSHRLPAVARQAGEADRRIPGEERDRHAHRLRLCHAVRRGPAHGVRVRPHRRRQERAGAPASRRHHPRRVRRRQPGARGARASSRRKDAACWSSCATAPPACRRTRSRRPARPASEVARSRQWREVGLGAQILKDLGISSIRLLTSRRAHLCRPYRLRHRDLCRQSRWTAMRRSHARRRSEGNQGQRISRRARALDGARAHRQRPSGPGRDATPASAPALPMPTTRRPARRSSPDADADLRARRDDREGEGAARRTNARSCGAGRSCSPICISRPIARRPRSSSRPASPRSPTRP